MREILFKAKRVENGEWIEGYYYKVQETVYCFEEDYEKNPVPIHHFIIFTRMTDWELQMQVYQTEIIPETLCQFTGLCDKNGKKIWENDILMAHLDESYPEDAAYETVEWNVAGWVAHETGSTDREYIDKFDLEHYEVVGNTFDNPELLQEEHK
jgi:uncharacterized phage protein (TIGR01671 family)|nr:MAG TPA: YopX protein [Caudoviricetes sp.]